MANEIQQELVTDKLLIYSYKKQISNLKIQYLVKNRESMYKQQQKNFCLQLRYFFDIDRLLKTTCIRIVKKNDQRNFAEIVTETDTINI